MSQPDEKPPLTDIDLIKRLRDLSCCDDAARYHAAERIAELRDERDRLNGALMASKLDEPDPIA